MPQRRVSVEGIGEVTLAKRRGSSNMSLMVNAKGQVRVGVPYWTSYETALMFLLKKRSWVLKHLAQHAPQILHHGSCIGKTHQIIIKHETSKDQVADIKIIGNKIVVATLKSVVDKDLQKLLHETSDEVLIREAKTFLPFRVEALSRKYNAPYNKLRIRRMTSRWGSCTKNKDISLSSYLIQLPWELIDYVILHELTHTKHLNHGPEFWRYIHQCLPTTSVLRQQIRQYKPRVAASKP